MSLIVFFIGVVLFFKGGFRLAGRNITKAQSRSMALILIAPFVLEFCASLIIVMSNPNIIQFSADGTSASINQDAFGTVANTIGTLELIFVGIALLIVIFTFISTPKSDMPQIMSSPQTPSGSPSAPPNILTVAEAAAYMRITEKEVLGLIDQGKLGAARIGDSYRIARIAIENFMTGG